MTAPKQRVQVPGITKPLSPEAAELHRIMRENDWTCRDVAQLLGRAIVSVKRWRCGVRELPKKHIDHLLAATKGNSEK